MWGNSSHVPTSDSTKYTIRKEPVCALSLFNHVSCQMSINNIGYPWHHYLCLGCNLRNTKKETIMTIILYIFLTIFLQERLFNTKLMSIFHRTLIFKKFDCAIMLETVPGTNQYSPMRVTFHAQGNNRSLWWRSHSLLTKYESDPVTHCCTASHHPSGSINTELSVQV